jgi:hypothetical protein
MKVLIKTTTANKAFLKRYTDQLIKAETGDEVGMMMYGILSSSFNREKFMELSETDFCLKHGYTEYIEINLSTDKYKRLKNLLEIKSETKGFENVKPHPVEWIIYKRRKKYKYNPYRIEFCRETTVSVNNYIDKVLHRVFLYFMQIEVNQLNQKITTSIEKFQQLYDLSDDDFRPKLAKGSGKGIKMTY